MTWHSWKWTLARRLGIVRADAELDEEIRAHLAMETRQRIEAGDTPEMARASAVKDFGNVTLVKETTRDVWAFTSLERLRQDARYGMRSLCRSPGFTLLALGALALGIGSTTAMFTVFYSVVIRPLPFPGPDRLVTLWEQPPRSSDQNVVSLHNFKAWQERSRSFEAMAAYVQGAMNLIGRGGDESVQITGTMVTAAFFRVLRVEPILGRGFARGEDGPAAPPFVVLGHGLWQRRFGGQASVIGRRISIGGTHHEIIGVLPADFVFPNRRGELFTNQRADYDGRDFRVVARLRPKVELHEAQAEMKAIAAGTAEERPVLNAGWSATVTPLHEQTVGQTRSLLSVLFAAVAFVLLIACANVANLLLMRSTARDREMTIRLALGAGTWRLAHQLLVESLLLAGAGGLLGITLAHWGLRALLGMVSVDFPLPRLHEIGVDSTVLWFAVVLCVTVGVLFGMAPIVTSRRRELSQGLRQGSLSVASGQRRFRQVLVVTEVAVALVLVVGAGLMIRSVLRLGQVEPGFQADRVLTVQMMLLPSKPQFHVEVVEDMLRRVREVSQVVSASSIHVLPMSGFNSSTWYCRADLPEPPRESRPGGDISLVMPDYFRTMGIRILRGRDFGHRDRLDTPHVGILNQSAARKFFGNDDPLGKRLTVSWNDAGEVEIVGVVSDIRHSALHSDPEPSLFLPHTQLPFPYVSLVIRTLSDPLAVAADVKEHIRQVDADQGVARIETMEERVASTTAQPRVQAWFAVVFSLLALALACIGIYGVTSYAVAQRTREIGVRVALGAAPLTIFWQMLRESLALTSAGIGMGLLAAVVLTRYLETFLFDVEPTDPMVYVGVVAFMLIVATAACYLPSRRAATIDPNMALRDE